MNLKTYPLNSLRRHPARTAGLCVLVALLCSAVLGGSLVIGSLQNGLASLEARMGADILVAPKSASTTTNLEDILINGIPGYFYMDKSYVDKVAQVEGVERVSPQYYLASVKAGCCSMPVQIIGIDPQTDFTIQPWIDHSYGKELQRGEVAVGANITGQVGSTIRFYGRDCTIVAKLDNTGTALDNAAFCDVQTITDLIEGSVEQGIAVLTNNDPNNIVSTVQVKVDPDHNVQDVTDYINLHVRGVKAVRSKAMTTGVASSMAGISRVVGILVAVVWVLAVTVLFVALWVLGRQRTKEFAVLRVLGAPSNAVARVLVTENLIVSAVGALAGIAVALLAMLGFSGALEQALGLPFLLPSVPSMAIWALLTLAMALAVGVLTSAFAARRIAKVDASQILRDE